MRGLRFARLAGRQIVATCVILAASYVVPPLAAAGCGQNAGYHYAGQHTSNLEHLVQCPASLNFYHGWNGVNGRLKVPATTLSLTTPTIDHANGYLDALFYGPTQPYKFLQIGWMIGTIALNTSNCVSPTCIRRTDGTYGWYAENYRAAVAGEYFIYSYGAAGLGAVTTSRVVWNGSTGCWETYLTYVYYPNYKLRDCSGEPATAAMVASAETFSAFGPNSIVRLPPTYFGIGSPATNDTLRLHGASVWEDWDTSLLAHGTESRDERFTAPKYVKTDFNAHYYFEADYVP